MENVQETQNRVDICDVKTKMVFGPQYVTAAIGSNTAAIGNCISDSNPNVTTASYPKLVK
jgi:hypothetical protein